MIQRSISIFLIGILLLLGILAAIKISTTGNTNLQAVASSIKEDPDLSLYQYRLEVADTPYKRKKGLRGRKELPPMTGMIFVFDKLDIQCMWNKGVSFPLRVMFLADTGEIINEDTMPAGSESPVCSNSPVKTVIEINP